MQQSMWDMVIYILATLPPQILHLLARFGKGTPEGAQLAVDATLASPLTSAGQPKRRAGRYARAPKQGKQRSRFTPNCKAQAGAVWSSWPLNLGGGGPEAAHFIRSLAHTKPRATPPHLRQASITALMARWTVSLTPAAMHANASSLLFMPHPCYPCRVKEPSQGKTPSRSWRTSSPTPGGCPCPQPIAWAMTWPFLLDFLSWIFLVGFRYLGFRRGGFGQ